MWIRYKKQEADPAVPPYQVRESGLYLYAGIKAERNLGRSLQATLGAGIKNFHLSFNNLDVNPHGVLARAGLQYRIRALHD